MKKNTKFVLIFIIIGLFIQIAYWIYSLNTYSTIHKEHVLISNFSLSHDFSFQCPDLMYFIFAFRIPAEIGNQAFNGFFSISDQAGNNVYTESFSYSGADDLVFGDYNLKTIFGTEKSKNIRYAVPFFVVLNTSHKYKIRVNINRDNEQTNLDKVSLFIKGGTQRQWNKDDSEFFKNL